MEKIIQYAMEKTKIACDGCCDKAWGANNRPSIQLSDDLDDYYFLSDSETGLAPIDPGTYEGGHGKPTSHDQFPNKWCARECERSAFLEEGQSLDSKVKLPDFSKRLYNQPWKHPLETEE